MNALFLALHLLAAPLAFASGGPPSPPSAMAEQEDDDMGLMANFAAVSQELGLSEDQKTKIKDLFYASQKEAIDLRAQAQRAQLDLRHAMGQDTPDEKAVLKALDAHLAAEAAIKRNRVKLVLDLRKAVTVEQWRKLQAMRERRGGPGMGGGMGPGGMGPGGGMGGGQNPPAPAPSGGI